MKLLRILVALVLFAGVGVAQDLTYDNAFVNSGQVTLSWPRGSAFGAYSYQYSESTTTITVYPYPEYFDEFLTGQVELLTDYQANGDIIVNFHKSGYPSSRFIMKPGHTKVLQDVIGAWRAAPAWLEEGRVRYENRFISGEVGGSMLVIKFGADWIRQR